MLILEERSAFAGRLLSLDRNIARAVQAVETEQPHPSDCNCAAASCATETPPLTIIPILARARRAVHGR